MLRGSQDHLMRLFSLIARLFKRGVATLCYGMASGKFSFLLIFPAASSSKNMDRSIFKSNTIVQSSTIHIS